MASEIKPGGLLKVTITKAPNRHAAKLTIERLFMQDKVLRAPLDARSANFIPLPRRRGGRIWTKHPNKIHPTLTKGVTATVKATAQHIRDLASVSTFVEVAPA